MGEIWEKLRYVRIYGVTKGWLLISLSRVQISQGPPTGLTVTNDLIPYIVVVSTSLKPSIQNCTTPARQNNMYYLIDKGLDLGIIAVASETTCCLKS